MMDLGGSNTTKCCVNTRKELYIVHCTFKTEIVQLLSLQRSKDFFEDAPALLPLPLPYGLPLAPG